MNSVNIGGGVSRTYHHGALAEAMVDFALAEVRKHGAEQLSLRAVTHALDVSPSAAYNHFADKDALLRAVGACGLAMLDERMARSRAAHSGTDDASARARFTGLGRAYLGFAVDEPHLFRLTFGPVCHGLGIEPEATAPYQKLVASLNELDARGLLVPGVREGLDVTVWAATHGMACLVVEGALPSEAIAPFTASLYRLISGSDE